VGANGPSALGLRGSAPHTDAMNALRRILAVRVTDDARRAIEEHCRRNDITVTAWVEAIGRRLREHNDSNDPIVGAAAAETIRLAREIDAARRSRA
jgi:hypothetical protein